MNILTTAAAGLETIIAKFTPQRPPQIILYGLVKTAKPELGRVEEKYLPAIKQDHAKYKRLLAARAEQTNLSASMRWTKEHESMVAEILNGGAPKPLRPEHRHIGDAEELARAIDLATRKLSAQSFRENCKPLMGAASKFGLEYAGDIERQEIEQYEAHGLTFPGSPLCEHIRKWANLWGPKDWHESPGGYQIAQMVSFINLD